MIYMVFDLHPTDKTIAHCIDLLSSELARNVKRLNKAINNRRYGFSLHASATVLARLFGLPLSTFNFHRRRFTIYPSDFHLCNSFFLVCIADTCTHSWIYDGERETLHICSGSVRRRWNGMESARHVVRAHQCTTSTKLNIM